MHLTFPCLICIHRPPPSPRLSLSRHWRQPPELPPCLPKLKAPSRPPSSHWRQPPELPPCLPKLKAPSSLESLTTAAGAPSRCPPKMADVCASASSSPSPSPSPHGDSQSSRRIAGKSWSSRCIAGKSRSSRRIFAGPYPCRTGARLRSSRTQSLPGRLAGNYN